MEIPDHLIKLIDDKICNRVLSMLQIARSGCGTVRDNMEGFTLALDCEYYETLLCLVCYCYIAGSELRGSASDHFVKELTPTKNSSGSGPDS